MYIFSNMIQGFNQFKQLYMRDSLTSKHHLMRFRVRIGQRSILLVVQRQLLNYIRRDREIWDPVAQEGWYNKWAPPFSNAKSAEIFYHRFIGLFYRYFQCISLLKWISCWHNGRWRIYYGQQFTGVYDIMLCVLNSESCGTLLNTRCIDLQWI